MDFSSFRAQHYLFDPLPYGRIFVFVDFGNVRPWAKELWPVENARRFCIEIDIGKLAEVCDWVEPKKKLFYYGHYPPGHPQESGSVYRIDKARKAGFRVKTKEIKMIPQYDEGGVFLGKRPKCNFDVEMTMDMLMKIEKYDTVMMFSGDSDFGGLLGYIKSKGRKVIVVCTRSRLSTELQSVADRVVPAEFLASFLSYQRNTPPRVAEV